MLLTTFFRKRKGADRKLPVEVDLADLDPELDRLLRDAPVMNQGPWTVQEDLLLIEAMTRKGIKRWRWVATQVPTRCGKQVRERWTNHLDPGLSQDPLLPEERGMLVEFVNAHGRKWSDAARALSAWRKEVGLEGRRADNFLKNSFIAMKPGETGKHPLLKMIAKPMRAPKRAKHARLNT